ncbi:hypothetical protein [Vibrio ezurae]|uniref:Uncharacterized protein n=1 Tax=Vibrio ezurae NBRC 102218 TaxID=1219080 RepID=U3CI47_9VIBR|nr:hypothetical protein [Vibrio ezurae]GAD80829.1 hypothetical protein VEZ01S_44_00320 [Vibrio ezurae NBRC 102218]
MRNFEILERGEKYFRCSVDGKSHCRIIIDDYSKGLSLGKHRLHVEEITDRYVHFAHDAVFKLTLPLSQQHSIEICTLKAGRKNTVTYKECLRLGGKWEPILNEWVFSSSVKDKVEQLRSIVKSRQILVEIKFKETISHLGKNLTIFGYETVKGIKVNNAPILGSGITLKKGDITFINSPISKIIIRSGTVLRLKIPEKMLISEVFREDYLAATDLSVLK